MENDNENAAEETQSDVVDSSFATCQLHRDSVYCASFHPINKNYIISGGGDDVSYLWTYDGTAMLQDPDRETGPGKGISSYIALASHRDTVTSVGFSADGKLAFSAGYDGMLKIFDAYTGQLLAEFDGPQDIEWAQWHTKGNAIIAGSNDGTIWMWVVMDGSWRCAQVR